MDGNGDNNVQDDNNHPYYQDISVMELVAGDQEESEGSSNDEEEVFDISIPASHSYMTESMRAVAGRRALAPGWRGRLVVAPHHSVVFPGDTVPLLLPRTPRMRDLIDRIANERVFGLLCPDASGSRASALGVVCELLEAGLGRHAAFRARATARLRLRGAARARLLNPYLSLNPEEIEVLPELRPEAPLRLARLAALDARPRPLNPQMQRLEAIVSPWPAFLYHMFDYKRIRQEFVKFFKTLGLESLPEEPVALSFWVASNLSLSPRDHAALLAAPGALQRLTLALRLTGNQKTVLCCTACRTEVALRRHIFAMSSEGLHSHYTNLGGYIHDVVTVSRARNLTLEGVPSAEYSWFPGYAWTIALCGGCANHLGWRFNARKRNLKPQEFFGLCRRSVSPRAADRDPERALDPTPDPDPDPAEYDPERYPPYDHQPPYDPDYDPAHEHQYDADPDYDPAPAPAPPPADLEPAHNDHT